MEPTSYKEVDLNQLAEKMTETVLYLIKDIKEGDTGEELFNYVRDKFSYGELLMMVSVNIAKDVNEKLNTDPTFRHLSAMARLEDMRNKQRNK